MGDFGEFERSITLRTFTGVSVGADGRETLAGAADTLIYASVQPVDQHKASRMGYGSRANDLRKIYCTDTPLRTVDQHTGRPADRLVIDGDVFEIIEAKPYNEIIPHTRAIAIRLPEGDPSREP